MFLILFEIDVVCLFPFAKLRFYNKKTLIKHIFFLLSTKLFVFHALFLQIDTANEPADDVFVNILTLAVKLVEILPLGFENVDIDFAHALV